MGLETTHGAYCGGYISFNWFRKCVCHALGPDASHPPHYLKNASGEFARDRFDHFVRDESLEEEKIYLPDAVTRETSPGLWEFLTHSDCDGEISPEMCTRVADELEALLPAIESLNWTPGGHNARDGSYANVARRFIAGCRAAASANEPLEFL